MTHYGFAHLLGSTGSIGPRVAYLVIGLILILLAFGVFAKAATVPVMQTLHGANGFDVNIDANVAVLFNTGLVAFTTDTNKVCMEPGTTHAQPIQVYNLTDTKKCFSLDVQPYNMPLDATLTQSDFCVNAFESTSTTLSANTENADLHHYIIKISDFDDTTVTTTLDYTVGACNSFSNLRMEENDATVCAGTESKIPVTVSNYSNNSQTIVFNAENQLILPYFEKGKMIFSAGSTKTVNLIVNASHATVGTYPLTLTATMQGTFVEKKMDLSIIDCSQLKKRTLELSVPNICYDVTRGQTFSGSVGVRCIDQKQNIALALFGAFNGALSRTNLELNCNTEARVNYTVQVPQITTTGKHYVSISGTTQPISPFADESTYGFTDSKSVCFNVLGESNASVSLSTSEQKTIMVGKSETFHVTVTNTGDFPVSYKVSTVERPTGVQVYFPTDTLTLAQGESTDVAVVISPNVAADIADNQFVRIVFDGNVPLYATMYFNITEAPQSADLEIVSATKSLELTSNSVANYFLMVRNGSDKTISNIDVNIVGLPADINGDTHIIESILPGNTMTINGTLTIGDVNGYFEPTFVVHAGELSATKKVILKIRKNTTANDTNSVGFFGLFGLESTSTQGNAQGLGVDLVGMTVSIFLIILVLVLVIFGVKVLTAPQKEEAWTRAN